MSKLKIICKILIIVFLAFPAVVSASEVVLKSGQTIEGTIVEKTDKYIKLNTEGTSLTYYFDEIDTIDGQKLIVSRSAQRRPEEEKQSQDTKVPSQIAAAQRPQSTFSTAVISYRYSGGRKGTETVYVDMIHNRITQESNITVTVVPPGNLLAPSGQTMTKNEGALFDGTNFYTLDFKNNTAVTEPLKVKAIKAVNMIFHENSYLDYYTGQGTVLGKECKIYEPPSAKFFFWNGIALKEELNNDSLGNNFNFTNFTKEATDIKTDVPIPDKKFKVPAGMKIVTPQESIQESMKLLEEKLKGLKNKVGR